jgi:RES domain-containing protein
VARAIDAVHVSGEWVRHAPHRSDLLGRSAIAADGRWQRGDQVPGLYLADDATTAVAEWYRFLAELGMPPARGVPHDHHVWRLGLDVADLSTARQLAGVGLTPPRPGTATWGAYQELGEMLWRDGWAGLIAPSAARPEGRVVCIFADRWPPEGCTPLRTEEITETPPPPRGMTT